MATTLIKKGKNAGHYRVRIQPRDKVTGKMVNFPSRVTKTTSKAEAKQLERQMWAEYKKKAEIETSMLDQPLSDAFEEYVLRSHSEGKWEDSTYRDWKYSSKLIKQYFGHQKIKDVRESDISDFAHQYVKKHKATVAKHTTIDRQLQNLRAFFNRMERYGLAINPVPCGALKEFFKKGDMTVKAKQYVFSSEEVKHLKATLLASLDGIQFIYWGSRLAILIALDTGMRPQEIQALRWNDLVKEDNFTVCNIHDSWCESAKRFNGHLKARMNGESRYTLSLSPELTDVLAKFHKLQKNYLTRKGIHNNNNLVLLNLTDYERCIKGIPISQKTMNDMLKRTAKKIDVNNGPLRVTMYTCRHTVATKLGNTPGMSYPWAADRMGHSLQMFMRTYVHPDQDLNAAMLKLTVA